MRTQWLLARALKAKNRCRTSFLYSVSTIPALDWTPQDLTLSGGTLADDSTTQCCGDWDEVECWAGVGHRNAGNGHCIQGIEAMVFTHFQIVELKDRYGSRNDLSLCVSLVSEGLGDNEDQEDESWVSVGKADARLINRIGFTGNGERNGVTLEYKGASLFETQNLQRLCGEVENETLLGNSGGEIEIVKVSWGDTGDGEVGITTKRRVENGGIDVVE